ncbi:MAG TPA: SIR2 family protein [Candidatus Eubacterium faecavium]|nr:SIR2 family protein [Candidatus Eubacterium faecavium]
MLTCLSHEKESFIPTALIHDLRAGNVLAWVGAGLSIGMGYPSWESLICKIAENIDSTQWGNSKLQDWAINTANSAPEWVAEVLSQADPKAYYDALSNEFGHTTKKASVTHALLALLPFRGYITTNYDSLIEDSIAMFTNYKPDVYTSSNAKLLLTKDQKKKYVYKVHGSINESVKDLVLTETNYYALLHDGVFGKILSSMLSKYTLVGFGYSLRDRDFRSILNERYELFGNNCPPFYMFTSSKDTCAEEIECYKKRFNVHIVSVSPEYGFEELTSAIFSMYCLCHRIESKTNLNDISELLETRLNSQSILLKIKGNTDLEKANKFLSGIKDPLSLSELVSMLSENGINITSSHVELLCKWVDNESLICAEPSIKDTNRIGLSRLIKRNLDIIPVDDNPKFLSSYYKGIIDKYYNTLSYLLKHKDSFNILITNKNELKRIVEYYKQQGLWKEWLDIAFCAQEFCDKKLETEILQSIAWVYFWTRDYDNLKILLNKNPKIDQGIGVNNYATKLDYMTEAGLNTQEKKLRESYDKGKSDYFDISLLGRIYARLAVLDINKKEVYLCEAEKFVRNALKLANEKADMIEIAVQNWYLALVLIDEGDVENAKIHLAETKRLDENIMERKPGIAWLRVAEYRLALVTNASNVQSRRRTAYKAMEQLGMKKIDDYLDKEYFF